MHKKAISSIFLVIFTAPTLYGESFFDQIEAQLMSLQKQMDEFAHFTPNSMLSSTISETKEGLTVTISGIDVEDLLANLNEDDKSLVVEARGATITIKTADTYICVNCQQESSSDADKEKEDKQLFYSSSASQTAKNCSRPIDLEKQTIQYDKDKKELCITFAFQEKRVREVPIQVVQNTKNESSEEAQEVEL